jgi:hypothetical protein
LKIYSSKGYLVSTTFGLLLAESEKVVEFMILTPRVPQMVPIDDG